MPAPSIALNAAIASARTSAARASSSAAGITVRESVVEVLRLVVVELARRDDLAGHRRLGIVVAEHGALRSRARCGTAASIDDLAIELRGERRSPSRSSAACFAFEMPTLDPRLAGFTNTGKPRRVDDASAATRALVALPVALQHDLVVADRQALARRRPASSPPCPCRRPTRARRRRRTARWRARAAPARCRPRRTGRAAPGRRRRARGRTRSARRRAIDRQQRVAAGVRHQVRSRAPRSTASATARLR